MAPSCPSLQKTWAQPRFLLCTAASWSKRGTFPTPPFPKDCTSLWYVLRIKYLQIKYNIKICTYFDRVTRNRRTTRNKLCPFNSQTALQTPPPFHCPVRQWVFYKWGTASRCPPCKQLSVAPSSCSALASGAPAHRTLPEALSIFGDISQDCLHQRDDRDRNDSKHV